MAHSSHDKDRNLSFLPVAHQTMIKNLNESGGSSADALVSAETDQRVMQMRIHDFIQQRLGDPNLTPRMIAEVHRISIRYLYKLFADQGLTVAGWIRQRRLERCRHEFADPRQRSRPVHEVAAGWGFTDAAHFSRLFRSVYGLPPGEYRRLSSHDDMRRQATTVHASSTTR